MPGAFSPLVARLVEELGFDGAYVSGAVVAADLGLPDVGLTTMTEVGQSKLLDARTLADLGVNLVIYPVTGLRLAMGAVG
jgi:2-methylisocitrate lyase-like PEP mutase family enzyme